MANERPRDRRRDLATFEPAFTEPTTEERVFSVLVQEADPFSVADVVDRVDCSKDTARKYLDWFAELGVAEKLRGRPRQYVRNEEYFEWRYASRLADDHTLAELRDEVADLENRLETIRERYDAVDPVRVDAVEAAAANDLSVEEVWDDLTTWAGLEDEVRLHDRARQLLADRDAGREANAD